MEQNLVGANKIDQDFKSSSFKYTGSMIHPHDIFIYAQQIYSYRMTF